MNRRLFTERALISIVVLCIGVAWADELDEIVLRCHYYMGEFGTEAVEMCVNNDLAAQKALADYPNTARRIVLRCTEHNKNLGWGEVKRCVDMDIAAAAALADYAAEHAPLIEQCREKFGRFGAARIKKCADFAIETEKAKRE